MLAMFDFHQTFGSTTNTKIFSSFLQIMQQQHNLSESAVTPVYVIYFIYISFFKNSFFLSHYYIRVKSLFTVHRRKHMEALQAAMKEAMVNEGDEFNRESFMTSHNLPSDIIFPNETPQSKNARMRGKGTCVSLFLSCISLSCLMFSLFV